AGRSFLHEPRRRLRRLSRDAARPDLFLRADDHAEGRPELHDRRPADAFLPAGDGGRARLRGPCAERLEDASLGGSGVHEWRRHARAEGPGGGADYSDSIQSINSFQLTLTPFSRLTFPLHQIRPVRVTTRSPKRPFPSAISSSTPLF